MRRRITFLNNISQLSAQFWPLEASVTHGAFKDRWRDDNLTIMSVFRASTFS